MEELSCCQDWAVERELCNLPITPWSPNRLQPRKAYLVSKPQVARWSEEYNLPRLIRGPEHQVLTIQNNERQKAQVFQAYIAAMFLQIGYLRTRAWMVPLVEDTYATMLTETEEDEVERFLDDGSDATSTASPPQSMGTAPSSPQPNPPSTPRRPSNMGSPRSPPASPSQPGALSAFNQLCSQNHLDAEWTELTVGKDHQRTYTMAVKRKLIFRIEMLLTALQSKETLRYWGGEPHRRREVRNR